MPVVSVKLEFAIYKPIIACDQCGTVQACIPIDTRFGGSYESIKRGGRITIPIGWAQNGLGKYACPQCTGGNHA